MLKKRLLIKITCILVSMFILTSTCFAFPKYTMNYVYDETNNQTYQQEGGKIYIPLTYTATSVYSYINDTITSLSDPDDLFIDSKDNLFIADTGNNRIVELKQDGTTENVFYGAPDSPFSAPQGVFVTKDGEIYVADTGNNRVVELNSGGTVIKNYTRPKSDLLTDVYSFDPSKVAIGNTGYIYVIAGKEFMAIDNNDQFKGFIGATQLGFSFTQLLTNLFASKTQKSKLVTRTPPSYNNFTLDSEGQFVACSSAKTDQIRLINSVGANIYKSGFYGEISSLDVNNNPVYPQFVDLTVDKDGFISVLEQKSGKIYQYDAEGNILTVFSGLGNSRGFFNNPSSIATDSTGRIYVLDKGNKNIQIFEPTIFMNKIHEASSLYFDGDYDQSLKIWRNITEINSDYPLARKRIGDILYKDNQYLSSLNNYEIANDMVGYSQAFGQYMHQLFREYFGLFVLAAVFIIALLIFIFSKLKKYADKLLVRLYSYKKK